MRKLLAIPFIFIATTIGPADAQNAGRGGIRTETMERAAGQNEANELIWNLLGAVGLLGLLGFRSPHPDDSYHPAPLE